MGDIKNDEIDLFEKLVSEGPVDQDKLLDENEILSEDDKKKPEANQVNKSDDSKTKPKKPCANCTCGLADELEKEAQDKVQKSATEGNGAEKSSCGSCYLGDAFRCASCPYRGMPAFKPGEKVTIDTASDDI